MTDGTFTKDCEWHKMKYCHAKPGHCIGPDCSLYKLKYTQDDIQEKIEEEAKWIETHMNTTKEEDIMDRLMGLNILLKALPMSEGKMSPVKYFRTISRIKKLSKKFMKAKKTTDTNTKPADEQKASSSQQSSRTKSTSKR